MAAPKIFTTGTTGYIGGDALHVIVEKHPDWDITCLVRTPDKGALVAAEYPKIRLVYGDLDSLTLLEEESKNADVVLHYADADHEAAAQAIARGLSAHAADKPGFYIHTSGTGVLTFRDSAAFAAGDPEGILGKRDDKIFDDWDNIKDVTDCIPDSAFHRVVDKIVLAAGKQGQKTAIVCPPTIYGFGRGPGNKKSIQVPLVIKTTLERKEAVQVGPGETRWNNVHVHDLSNVYLRLAEEAVKGGGDATWGVDGYYFVESGDHALGDIARAVAANLHKKGFIPTDEVKSLPALEVVKIKASLAFTLGANSRCKAIRARKLLGWEPKAPTIWEEMEGAVVWEAKALGLIKGHAEVATGNA